MKRIILAIAVAVIYSATASAQLNLGSLLGSVKDAVAEKATEAASEATGEQLGEGAANAVTDLLKNVLGISVDEDKIPGTWSYVQPAVEFESADALTNAGGTIVAESVEDKIAPMFTKLGIKAGAVVFILGEDGKLTISVGKKNVTGTWTYNKESEEVSLSLGNKAPKTFTTRMTVNGDNINILFKADKLLELVKTIAASSSNTSLAAIGTMVKAYDGMNIGFEMARQ